MLGPAIVSQFCEHRNVFKSPKPDKTWVYKYLTICKPPQEAPEQQTLTAVASPEVNITVSRDEGPFRIVSSVTLKDEYAHDASATERPPNAFGLPPDHCSCRLGGGDQCEDQHLVPVYRTGTSVSSQVTLQDAFKTLHVVSYFWIKVPFFLSNKIKAQLTLRVRNTLFFPLSSDIFVGPK